MNKQMNEQMNKEMKEQNYELRNKQMNEWTNDWRTLHLATTVKVVLNIDLLIGYMCKTFFN